jgi:hypothetical protein
MVMATRIATGSLETDLQWPSTAIDHGTIQCSDGSPSIFEACEIDESKAFAFGGVVVANGFDIGDGTERSKQSIECRIISFSRQIVYKHTEWSGSCRHTRTEREREREREGEHTSQWNKVDSGSMETYLVAADQEAWLDSMET